MNEKKYFELSKENNLPIRCPILNQCARRAETIYIFSEFQMFEPSLTPIEALKKTGDISEYFEDNMIETQEEHPDIIRGNSSFAFNNACPEVNLFNLAHALIPKVACSSGSYDKYYPREKTKVKQTKHFSECAEFNKYQFERGVFNERQKKRRKSISYKTKALLQKEINSECPFCENLDVLHFHVHHIDENRTNNDISNLMMLCPTCHSKITKGDISISSVMSKKESLKSK